LERPSLIVVGSGIRIIGQMTTETAAWVKISEAVLYLGHDPIVGQIVSELNPCAKSLADCYAEGKPRRKSYDEMVARVMRCVRSGKRTCLLFYGHPGMFCWPGHESIRQARQEGYTARMLPGVSSEDCLFADLGLDPATHGCQSYEAMEFLKNARIVDPSALLILWQIGVMGDPLYKTKGFDLAPLPFLIERLCRTYAPNHEVILYTASIAWGGNPGIQRVPLSKLAGARLNANMTLCIPPGQPVRPDLQIYQRFGLALPGADDERKRRGRKTSGKSAKRRKQPSRP
jgi:Tetrapyrrole (Corrin/Porphyrin) Methylases